MAATSRLNASEGRKNRTARAIGIATAAASSRRPTVTDASAGRLARFRHASAVDHAAVAPLALLEVEDRLEEVTLPEVGPERRRHPDLAVGDLPEEEVRHPHLSGSADQEVRIRQTRGREAGAERLLVDLLRGQPSRGDVVRERAAGVHDLGPPAVVERDVERHPPAGGGAGEPAGQLLLDRTVELVHAPDHAEPDVVLEQVRELLVQILLQERHQRHDLEARPLPVLDREGVKGQCVELQTGAALDDLAHRRDARAVPLDARKAALPRPAAVAVHDDRDVPRKAGEVDLVEEPPLGGARRGDFVLLDHGTSVTRGYSTFTSVSPFAGAFCERRPRSPDSTISRIRSGGTRPLAMSPRRPQIDRTIPRRKPSPRKSARSSEPSSSIDTEWSVLTESAGRPRAAKTPKSRRPGRCAAAIAIGPASAPRESGATKRASRGAMTSARDHRYR